VVCSVFGSTAGAKSAIVRCRKGLRVFGLKGLGSKRLGI
jgi:hypothetical protein